MQDLNKFIGCLIGGAAGDALGYEVEFLRASQIFRSFGEGGITQYVLHHGKACISDDTQMTLFTACGLLIGAARGRERGIMGEYYDYIYHAYRDWYRTQRCHFPLSNDGEHVCTWLAREVPGLFSPRAPGNTCMSALGSGRCGTIEQPINTSKGCGGVMRVAPIGLYFDVPRERRADIDRIGAQAAAITHGHQLGYIPAAALVHLIQSVAHDPDITLMDAALETRAAIAAQYADAIHLQTQLELIDRAISLSKMDINDLDAIRTLGAGWVGEEAFAIALYCALKYEKDFDRAMIAAVNHDGDSDSTGAIAGNILGAYLGIEGIPAKYTEHLELRDVITELAEDLYYDSCSDAPEHIRQRMGRRYD